LKQFVIIRQNRRQHSEYQKLFHMIKQKILRNIFYFIKKENLRKILLLSRFVSLKLL